MNHRNMIATESTSNNWWRHTYSTHTYTHTERNRKQQRKQQYYSMVQYCWHEIYVLYEWYNQTKQSDDNKWSRHEIKINIKLEHQSSYSTVMVHMHPLTYSNNQRYHSHNIKQQRINMTHNNAISTNANDTHKHDTKSSSNTNRYYSPAHKRYHVKQLTNRFNVECKDIAWQNWPSDETLTTREIMINQIRTNVIPWTYMNEYHIHINASHRYSTATTNNNVTHWWDHHSPLLPINDNWLMTTSYWRWYQ